MRSKITLFVYRKYVLCEELFSAWREIASKTEPFSDLLVGHVRISEFRDSLQ